MAEAGTVAAFREAVMVLQADVINIAGECLLEHKQEVVGVLVQQQQIEGVDSKGKSLRRYSPLYMRYKREIGKSGDTDFDLTGQFHGEMNLTVDGSQYSFDSPATTDKGELKSSWLTKWNKSEIMELTEENKGVVWRIIAPTFNEKVGSRFD